MVKPIPFTGYNLAVGVITGIGILYFLFFKPTVIEYHRFLFVTVAGLLLFLVGGPVTELVVPELVHWVHGIASILVILGLYDPLENDVRGDARSDLLLRQPDQIRPSEEWMLPIDNEILNLFHPTDLVLTPSIIAYNIGYSREEVNRRLTSWRNEDSSPESNPASITLRRLGTGISMGRFRGPSSLPPVVMEDQRMNLIK